MSKKGKKRKILQISGTERARLPAPRQRVKGKIKKVIKAHYGTSHRNANTGYCGAAGWQGSRGGGVGFANHAHFFKPKLKDISLVITTAARRKMQFWLDVAQGEFAGFGICGNIKDPLRITDFVLLDQRAGMAHADLDDIAIALHYNDMADAGLEVVQYGRIWFHTHPFGVSKPNPSGGDDSTFKTAFGDCNWSVMLVFSNRAQAAYAEIQVPAKILGRSISNLYELDIDYESDVTEAEAVKWGGEFATHVKALPRVWKGGKKGKGKVKKVKSGKDKLDDALLLLGDDNLVDIDALDAEYEQNLALDAQEHTEAVAKIVRRAN